MLRDIFIYGQEKGPTWKLIGLLCEYIAENDAPVIFEPKFRVDRWVGLCTDSSSP